MTGKLKNSEKEIKNYYFCVEVGIRAFFALSRLSIQKIEAIDSAVAQSPKKIADFQIERKQKTQLHGVYL